MTIIDNYLVLKKIIFFYVLSLLNLFSKLLLKLIRDNCLMDIFLVYQPLRLARYLTLSLSVVERMRTTRRGKRDDFLSHNFIVP